YLRGKELRARSARPPQSKRIAVKKKAAPSGAANIRGNTCCFCYAVWLGDFVASLQREVVAGSEADGARIGERTGTLVLRVGRAAVGFAELVVLSNALLAEGVECIGRQCQLVVSKARLPGDAQVHIVGPRLDTERAARG